MHKQLKKEASAQRPEAFTQRPLVSTRGALRSRELGFSSACLCRRLCCGTNGCQSVRQQEPHIQPQPDGLSSGLLGSETTPPDLRLRFFSCLHSRELFNGSRSLFQPDECRLSLSVFMIIARSTQTGVELLWLILTGTESHYSVSQRSVACEVVTLHVQGATGSCLTPVGC